MKRYGLIGYPLGHSFSRHYFSQKFQDESITDTVYQNFPIPTISELPGLLQQFPDLCGLNITIPYKKEVLAYLHQASDAVSAIAACNCVKISNGLLVGYNTDIIGFEKSLSLFLQPHHRNALILGTGGAASAVAYVCEQLGITYKYVSRTPSEHAIGYEELNAKNISDFPLIINTTPLGMAPDTGSYPPLPYEAMSSIHHCFDLIYNPAETVFLQKAKAAGASTQNGYEMLVIQAEESWKIWNS